MTKIGEINPAGVAKLMICYDDKAKTNPYRVIQEWKELGSYGLKTRRKTIVKYADLYSCMLVLTRYCEAHNEEGR